MLQLGHFGGFTNVPQYPQYFFGAKFLHFGHIDLMGIIFGSFGLRL